MIVQRARAKSSGSANHTEASKLENFELPPTCLTTLRDESFVLFDGVTDEGSRMIIFTTARNLQILAEHPGWLADGTFYVAPRLFQQSYSIHAVIDGKCLPLVFALLSTKTQKTYEFFLNIIKSVIDVTDGIIMIDFELAAIKAFGTVFEQFSVLNCFFHLWQSVQKQISKHFKVIYAYS